MIITTGTLLIVQALIVSWIVFTRPEPCPRIYKTLQEEGGQLATYGDIHLYCETDYGGKWKIKDEYPGK
jgi:hypothetical protein